MLSRFARHGAIQLAALGLSVTPAAAADGDDFFQGRTITITVGVAPGGGYDLYARLAAEFLGRHLPGKPTIVVANMPGGGGLRAAMALFNNAPRDGTALCAIVQSVGFDSVLGELPVRANEFNFIGRMTSSIEMQLVWHSSPTKNLEDAKARVTVVGATGTSSPSAIVPKLLNDAIGTKFKVVGGYPGTQDSSLAMERGEVEGTLKSLESLQFNNRDWLEMKKVNILWQLAMHPAPGFEHVPAIGQLGDDPDARAMLRLIASTAEIGRSLATAPRVPADRVRLLRQSFQRMAADPEFQAAARQRNAPLAIASGEDIQKIIEETVNTPAPIVERVKKIVAMDR
jgi:tripartite-type tricarboxylate transporter receptor subunit TctC